MGLRYHLVSYMDTNNIQKINVCLIVSLCEEYEETNKFIWVAKIFFIINYSLKILTIL